MKIAFITTDNREPFRQYDNPVPWFGTAPEALLQGFALLPSVEIHVVSCTQRPMRSPSRLAENIFFHSVPVRKIGWLKTGYLGCIRAVRKKLREIGPEIVHGQGTERECSISAVFSGYPNVLTIHGNMDMLSHHLKALPGSFLWCAGLLENFTLPRTAGVFCNSAYTESLVRPRTRRTWRVPNPLRAALFAPAAENLHKSPARVINVGVISPRKRQVELVACFKRLHERGVSCQIEFVGQVDEKSAYSRSFLAAMREAEGEGYALYSGSKDADSLVTAFDQAGGCIHFPTEEAFGLVVAEALARNLKFFGSRVGGIVDIVAPVPSAELFAPEDWAGLEKALQRWAEQDYPQPANAAESMAAIYHPLVVARRHEEIYREVLAGRTGQPVD